MFAASAATIGGVLLILVVAYGLTAYLIDADVLGTIASWTRQHVHSRLVFLLILNVFLLAVGCVMDIYSAILVVAPIVAAYSVPCLASIRSTSGSSLSQTWNWATSRRPWD